MLLAASVITAAAVWLVCDTLGAPAALLAMGCMAPLLAALLFACTYAGNISLHTSSAAASVTLLTLRLDPAWALLYLLVAAIGWSRLHLRAHTPAQVFAGAAAGAMVCSTMLYIAPLGAR
ncbi:phosphatase PAP2 family protein [Streptomyces sp. Je 1-332]|uniref:phosphatase PAP2 family protein n=1 Tax=Streptomyces sp. Je 1-332 TaxID=3231270 RepID=UPI003458F5FD